VAGVNNNPAALVAELEATVADLLDRHARKSKEWFPHELVPWGRGEDFEPGQVVVKLNPTVDTTIEKVNADYGLTTLEKLPGSTGIYLLKAPAGSDTQGVVGRLANDTRLSYAEPNFVAGASEDHAGDGRHKAYGISDTNGSFEQYAATALGLPCAAALTLGQNTTVAVIDTGAQLDHPQLAPNFEDVARYDFVDNDRNPTERSVGLDEDGKRFRFDSPAVEVVSAVGCGDVLLAALMHGLVTDGLSLEGALTRALPLAAANAASPGIADFELG
jgi:subtilisin family serine protease